MLVAEGDTEGYFIYKPKESQCKLLGNDWCIGQIYQFTKSDMQYFILYKGGNLCCTNPHAYGFRRPTAEELENYLNGTYGNW